MLKFFVIFVFSVIAMSALGNPTVDEYSNLGPRSEKLTTNNNRPIPKNQWSPAAKLWLARSCVGEAGFDSYDECLGIAWVYATRSRENGHKFVTMVRLYSSAVKRKANKSRKWIFHLGLRGHKPKNWPKKLSWRPHRAHWLRLLSMLDDWAKGYYENPVEGANHFGSPTDSPGRRWVKIRPKPLFSFRNIFYYGV